MGTKKEVLNYLLPSWGKVSGTEDRADFTHVGSAQAPNRVRLISRGGMVDQAPAQVAWGARPVLYQEGYPE